MQKYKVYNEAIQLVSNVRGLTLLPFLTAFDLVLPFTHHTPAFFVVQTSLYFGTHGLSCNFSEGMHSRHATLNDIIYCTLSAAKIASRSEPLGLARSDGKRRVGMTLVPWSLWYGMPPRHLR